MYLATSGDILNIVLALSILWIVFLISWLLFSIIGVVRRVHGVVENVHERIEAVDRILDLIREKLDSTSSYLGILVDVVREGMHWYRDREEGESFRKKKPNNKKSQNKSIAV